MREHKLVKPLPFFYVGKSISDARKASYAGNKCSLLSDAIGKPDTQHIWYAKEHIVKLLEELEHAGGDGIRIAFGTYEEGHEFEGQTCLIMNVTRAAQLGGVTVHPNVVLENEPDFAERSALEREIIIYTGDDGLAPRDFNYGSPCPPRCDPSSVG